MENGKPSGMPKEKLEMFLKRLEERGPITFEDIAEDFRKHCLRPGTYSIDRDGRIILDVRSRREREKLLEKYECLVCQGGEECNTPFIMARKLSSSYAFATTNKFPFFNPDGSSLNFGKFVQNRFYLQDSDGRVYQASRDGQGMFYIKVPGQEKPIRGMRHTKKWVICINEETGDLTRKFEVSEKRPKINIDGTPIVSGGVFSNDKEVSTRLRRLCYNSFKKIITCHTKIFF